MFDLGWDTLADRLLHHEVEGQVDGLVEEVEETKSQWVELVVELVTKMVKDVTEVSGLVTHLVTPENKRIKRYIYGLALQIRMMVEATEPTIIQSAVLKAGMLTNEAIRNGSLRKNTEKRGNVREPSKDGNIRDDYKRSRTGRAFASTTNPIRRKYTGAAPKEFCQGLQGGSRIVNPVNARNLTAARGAYFEYGGTDHYQATCSRLNRAPRQGGNHQNQAMAIEVGQGRRNNGNQAQGGAFMMGAEEARQDLNIVTGIKPSRLGFAYEIKIASRQLVEINKVIRGCKLEIEGHTIDIDLIPFGHGSFDVIVGMDWLSRHKAKIVSMRM
ncbi:reverse transcriptase domain-containing protein [Tanacetum coccineum]